jgi:hypothetical protein
MGDDADVDPLRPVLCLKTPVTAVTLVTTRMNIGDFCYWLLPLQPVSPLNFLLIAP